MRSAPHRPSRHRATRLCGSVAATLALGAIAASPAAATLGPGSPPEAGENITVFHNLDFVAVFNVGAENDSITIDVIRNGVTIGTTTGPLIDAGDGVTALEANHGPEGPAQAGDCWIGHSPDMRPGDVIRVTNNSALPAPEVDEVTIDDIGFYGPAVLQPNGDVTIDGYARRSDGLGTPIPIDFLDSHGFLETSKFRGPAHEVRRTPGTTDGFTNVFHPPYIMERDQTYDNTEDRRNALLGEGHEAGFGHVEVLPLEAMLLDGTSDEATTALGCDVPAQSNRINTNAPDTINAATGDLVLTGTRMAAAGDVTVTLSDGVFTTAALPATENGLNWSITITPEQRAGLADGKITAAGAYVQGGTTLTGRNHTIVKDTTISVPTASLDSGTYTGAQSVTLSSTGAGEFIEYTRDGTTFTPYSGPIAFAIGTHQLQFRSLDAAGNISALQTRDYTIAAPPAAVVTTETAAGPAPVVQQSVASSLSTLPAFGEQASSARRLRLAAIRIGAVSSLRSARRFGIAVSFAPAAGTRDVRITIRRAGSRKALVTRFVRVRNTSLRTVRLRSSKFRAGRYIVEVTPGAGGEIGSLSSRTVTLKR